MLPVVNNRASRGESSVSVTAGVGANATRLAVPQDEPQRHPRHAAAQMIEYPAAQRHWGSLPFGAILYPSRRQGQRLEPDAAAGA